MIKHGRGQQFNDKYMPNLEENGPSGLVRLARMSLVPDVEFTEVSDPAVENRPQKNTGPENGKMIKMFYSSNREEEESKNQQKEE